MSQTNQILPTLEATQILDEIGLSEQDVQHALEVGITEYNTATITHPRNTAATRMWQEVIKTLRDKFLTKGWSIPLVNEDQFSEINSPDGKWRLVVWSGDRYTGVADGSGKAPRSKNGKGGGTAEFISRNLSLSLNEPNIIKQNTTKTIAFIIHFDKRKNEVRSELALPVGLEYSFSKTNPMRKPKVNKYEWRVLFSPYSAGDIEIDVHSSTDDSKKTDFTDEIEIDIGFK